MELYWNSQETIFQHHTPGSAMVPTRGKEESTAQEQLKERHCGIPQETESSEQWQNRPSRAEYVGEVSTACSLHGARH